MKKKLLFTIIAIGLLSSFSVHKYYISLIKVEHSSKNKSIQVTMRIFIDDLQEVINTAYAKEYELAVPNEPATKVNQDISKYIQKMFSIDINGEVKTFKFLGKEYENDVVYLYIEVPNVNEVNTLKIKDRMLTEKFPDQKNIVKININNTKKTFFLTAEEDVDSFKFG